MRKLRKNFESQLASQLKTNQKPFWKYYKSKLTIKEGIGDLNTNPDDPNSTLTSVDKEKANILAEHTI